MTKRVVVVGGGITGLTAAYRLVHPLQQPVDAPAPEVVLIDSAERLGGKIHTTRLGGFGAPLVDEGADAFLLRVPWATELCEELGIASERISPAVGGASVVHQGPRGPQLTPLPDGLVGGVPTRLRPLIGSALLSPAAKLRVAADYLAFSYALAKTRSLRNLLRKDSVRSSTGSRSVDAGVGTDASVGDIVRTRLGSAAASRVVDPLLGSISAGEINRLDAATSAPILIDAMSRSRSLMRGLRRMQPASARHGPESPVFGSFEAGMVRLVSALVERLDGCTLRLGNPVLSVRLAQSARLGQASRQLVVGVAPEDSESNVGLTFAADAVILAVPAYAAAKMLSSTSAAADLAQIEYASVAVITLEVRRDAIRDSGNGSGRAARQAGFLVTRDTGWLTTACSYGSAKWPHWSGDDSTAILRVSVGRDDDDRHTKLSDAQLRDAVVEELSSLAPLSGLSDPDAVVAWRVSRWERSLPQYRPGHGRLVDRVEDSLAHELPGVLVAGAAYRGLGIPACIRQGKEAAVATIQYLANRHDPTSQYELANQHELANSRDPC